MPNFNLFENLPQPEVSNSEFTVWGGFEIKFSGLTNTLDLNESGMKPLKNHLAKRWHDPQEAIIIYDDRRKPRLAIVSGIEEIWMGKGMLGNLEPLEYIRTDDYHEIVRVNDQDDDIRVLGRTGLHHWGYKNNLVFNLDSSIRQNPIAIVQNKTMLIIQA